MKDVARIMKAPCDNILNCFNHPTTDASGECINSKIELMQRMAYEFRNKDHLRTAIYFKHV